MKTAKVVYYSPSHDVEHIELEEHVLQFGGMGDGYCYGHESFDCMEELSAEDLDAIRRAY